MEKTVEQITILGHQVEWSCVDRSITELSSLDRMDIQDAITEGFNGGNFLAHGASTCAWWIVNPWKELCTDMYNQLKFEIAATPYKTDDYNPMILLIKRYEKIIDNGK